MDADSWKGAKLAAQFRSGAPPRSLARVIDEDRHPADVIHNQEVIRMETKFDKTRELVTQIAPAVGIGIAVLYAAGLPAPCARVAVMSAAIMLVAIGAATAVAEATRNAWRNRHTASASVA